LTEEMLLGRAERPTQEIPLGRAKGGAKETSLGRTEETPLGHGFVPGDIARIEVGLFRHEMNLEEVLAFFEHEDDESHVIELRGQPKEQEPPSGGLKHSGVSLCAIVPADAPPGVSWCEKSPIRPPRSSSGGASGGRSEDETRSQKRPSWAAAPSRPVKPFR
jgi:hypothetical protein